MGLKRASTCRIPTNEVGIAAGMNHGPLHHPAHKWTVQLPHLMSSLEPFASAAARPLRPRLCRLPCRPLLPAAAAAAHPTLYRRAIRNPTPPATSSPTLANTAPRMAGSMLLLPLELPGLMEDEGSPPGMPPGGAVTCSSSASMHADTPYWFAHVSLAAFWQITVVLITVYRYLWRGSVCCAWVFVVYRLGARVQCDFC